MMPTAIALAMTMNGGKPVKHLYGSQQIPS